jgi:hypothetical protein
MTFFNSTEPIIRRKQHALDYQDLQGLWHFQVKIKDITLVSNIYTRIDQVFVVWGIISAAIFITAQFAPISWITQAIAWSVLTVVGTAATIGLTNFWVAVERLHWVVYTWAVLMLGGLVITDLGILWGWGQILMHLSDLWLGLCAIGYFCTGIGLRSRAFIFSGIIHALGILILPHVPGWQFLTTGLIMVVNLFVFAETQWDMRSPIENYGLLSEEQKQFNHQQRQLRQV